MLISVGSNCLIHFQGTWLSNSECVLKFGLIITIEASEMVMFFESRTGISPLVMHSGVVTVR